MSRNTLNWQLIFVFLLFFAGTVGADEGQNTLNIGDRAPDINLNDQDGNLWHLTDHLGKSKIVIYFYPAAMTGGCTKQACSYRDSKDELTNLGIVVVGISGDAVSGLKIFQQAHQLNFSLLSDASASTAKNYGVPTNKGGTIVRKINEKEVTLEHSFSASRWTFIVDESGKIIYKDTEVVAAEDGKKVIDFLTKKER